MKFLVFIEQREGKVRKACEKKDCWMELAYELRGFPRHLSQHPGGFVIARAGRIATRTRATEIDRDRRRGR